MLIFQAGLIVSSNNGGGSTYFTIYISLINTDLEAPAYL